MSSSTTAEKSQEQPLESTNVLTLEQFIIERQKDYPGAAGALTRLLNSISLASKIVHRNVSRAGIVDILGHSKTSNSSGEVQQKLDLLAHEEFVLALSRGEECALLGSEEHAEAIPIRNPSSSTIGKYMVLVDPLDGSSNIAVNASIGSIFSIYALPEGTTSDVKLEDVMMPGSEQVAAGYVIYGSSCMMVYTTGNGVNGFTLDPSIGEFILSHPNIKTPSKGSTYSVNEGNYFGWKGGLKKYIKWTQREHPETNRPYTSRYIGSLVADIHRNLLTGGIYIYPTNSRSPEGKIRLMYEANPLAFIVEQAGGKALNGSKRIMDIVPTKLHQRTPIYLGSPEMIDDAMAFLSGERDEWWSGW